MEVVKENLALNFNAKTHLVELDSATQEHHPIRKLLLFI